MDNVSTKSVSATQPKINALLKKQGILQAKIKKLAADIEYFEDKGAYFSADFALEDKTAASEALQKLESKIKKLS